jgi:hypothetical protein
VCRRGPPARRSPAASPALPSPAQRHSPPRLGSAGCVVRRKRAGVRAPLQPLGPGRRAALDTPGARRARRGVLLNRLTGHGLRGRAAHQVLPQPDRDQLRALDSQRHRYRLPLQGHNQQILVGPRGRHRAPRHRRAYDFRPANPSPSPAWSPSTTKGRPVPFRPVAPPAKTHLVASANGRPLGKCDSKTASVRGL